MKIKVPENTPEALRLYRQYQFTEMKQALLKNEVVAPDIFLYRLIELIEEIDTRISNLATEVFHDDGK